MCLPLKRKLPRLIALHALAAALLACSAHAQELTAVTYDMLPLHFEEAGTGKGYATELLQAILSTAKLKAPVTTMPWPRAYQTALEHPNTIIYAMTRTPERESLFEWYGPIAGTTLYLFKLRKRQDIQIKTLDDARRYRTGVIRERGSTRDLIRQGFAMDKQLDPAPTDESNVRKLFAGRVDLIVSLTWPAYSYAQRNGNARDELEPVLMLNNNVGFYFAVNRQSDPILAQKFRHAYEEVRSSGQMDKLKAKYQLN